MMQALRDRAAAKTDEPDAESKAGSIMANEVSQTEIAKQVQVDEAQDFLSAEAKLQTAHGTRGDRS